MTDTAVMPAQAKHPDADKTFLQITWRLLPYLALMWCLAWIDRININFAKLTMMDDLKFSDLIYGTGAGIFFIGYFFFEVPSNLYLRKVGARKTLMRIAIGWGAVCVAMMFVTTPIEFYICRFLLGAFEAGFQPGVLVYLTRWYPTERRTQAFGLFTSATAVSVIVGGPLAGFILKNMGGMGGLAGWQWIFLIEGAVTMVCGLAAWWILTEQPADAKWLTKEQKDIVHAELEADKKEEREESIMALLKVPVFWILTLIYFCMIAGYATMNFFSSTAVKELGFTDPLVIGWIVSGCTVGGAIGQIVISRSADKHKELYFHAAAAIALGSISLGMMGLMLEQKSTAGTLICLFLALTGTASSIPVFWQIPFRWFDGAAAAVAVAAINSIANLAGFFSSTFLGFLKDLTGTVSGGLMGVACFQFLGAVLILAALKRK